MIAKNTAKTVMFLLRNAHDVGHNINQVSKELDISVGSAFKILKGLEKEKIARVMRLGNAAYYRLDLKNPETVKICELLLMQERRKLTGYAKLYAEDLKEFKEAEMIILFGSVLKGNKFNDVDVYFATTQVNKAEKLCINITKTRTKPVVPLIIPKEELAKEIASRNEAITDMIKTGIVLKGETQFIEAIKDAKDKTGLVSRKREDKTD